MEQDEIEFIAGYSNLLIYMDSQNYSSDNARKVVIDERIKEETRKQRMNQ